MKNTLLINIINLPGSSKLIHGQAGIPSQPVSYTHLDVYKRQSLDSKIIIIYLYLNINDKYPRKQYHMLLFDTVSGVYTRRYSLVFHWVSFI